jgi:hypothetical protein
MLHRVLDVDFFCLGLVDSRVRDASPQCHFHIAAGSVSYHPRMGAILGLWPDVHGMKWALLPVGASLIETFLRQPASRHARPSAGVPILLLLTKILPSMSRILPTQTPLPDMVAVRSG